MMGYLLRNRVLFLGSRINDEVRYAWRALPGTYKSLWLPLSTILIVAQVACFYDRWPHCALQVATQIVASLLALETLSETEDIKMYINSPGAGMRSAADLTPHMSQLLVPSVDQHGATQAARRIPSSPFWTPWRSSSPTLPP